MSPWHCSVAVMMDGSFITAHKSMHRRKFNLIRKGSQPYFFREKSPLYEWEADDVEFEHRYGRNLVVQRRPGNRSHQDEKEGPRDEDKVRNKDSAEGPLFSERDLDKLAILAILHQSVKFVDK